MEGEKRLHSCIYELLDAWLIFVHERDGMEMIYYIIVYRLRDYDLMMLRTGTIYCRQFIYE